MPEDVAELKQERRGDILVGGSGSLVNTLKRHALVDEYRIRILPIELGSGMMPFDIAAEATTLRLKDITRFDSGTTVLTYSAV